MTQGGVRKRVCTFSYEQCAQEPYCKSFDYQTWHIVASPGEFEPSQLYNDTCVFMLILGYVSSKEFPKF